MYIETRYATNNRYYNTAPKMTPESIILHSTGDAVPSALNHYAYYNTTGPKASVHAFVEHTGLVINVWPYDKRAYHVAYPDNAPSWVKNSIAVEMCETSGIKYTRGSRYEFTDIDLAVTQTVNVLRAAIKYMALLCDAYDLNPLTAIYSHKEVASMGWASKHGDPEHLMSAIGYSMDVVREEVLSIMDHNIRTERYYNTLTEIDSAYVDSVSKLVKSGVLKGTHKGLELTRDMCRMITIMDRLGLLDG